MSVHLFINREIYFKKLVHMIVKASSSKSARWIGRLETQGRTDVVFRLQRQSSGRIPSSSGKAGLLLSWACLDEAHPHYRGLLNNNKILFISPCKNDKVINLQFTPEEVKNT